MNTIRTLFFPENTRRIKHRRSILNVLRSAHLLAISILVGGVFFHVEKNLVTPWLIAAVITGLSMFLLDLYESGVALFEARGASVILKMGLLLCIPLVENSTQVFLLILVIIFSAFISHSTKRIRHKNLLPDALNQHFGIDTKNNNHYKAK